MIPTVAQQLFAARNTIAKVVMPAIDTSDSFAIEQAGLVLACLDWAMDVQESEFANEALERSEYRRTLELLVALDYCDSARRLLDETADVPADLDGLRDHVVRLKDSVTQRYRAIASSGGPIADDAQRIVVDVARRQTQRELSWCRMTGFPQGVTSGVAGVIDAQRQSASSVNAVA
ncbi:hypothetical protein ACWDTI_09915 [Gordonia sp. NPDC003424]